MCTSPWDIHIEAFYILWTRIMNSGKGHDFSTTFIYHMITCLTRDGTWVDSIHQLLLESIHDITCFGEADGY